MAAHQSIRPKSTLAWRAPLGLRYRVLAACAARGERVSTFLRRAVEEALAKCD